MSGIHVQRPRFPLALPDKLANKIAKLKVQGRRTTFRSANSCRICRRQIGPLGRIIAPGFPACTETGCDLVRCGDVTALFPTPYGRAMTRGSLSMFSRLIDLPDGRMMALHEPVIVRATELAGAHADLIEWQKVYDAYEWHTHPDGYGQGRVELIPPRRIEDVLVLRVDAPPVRRDPTETLDPDTAHLLRRIRDEGEAVLKAPF